METKNEQTIEEIEKEILNINGILESAGALNLSFTDQVGLSADRDRLRIKLQKMKAAPLNEESAS